MTVNNIYTVPIPCTMNIERDLKANHQLASDLRLHDIHHPFAVTPRFSFCILNLVLFHGNLCFSYSLLPLSFGYLHAPYGR